MIQFNIRQISYCQISENHFLCNMRSNELIFSNHAAEVYKAIIHDLQQASLLAAEKVRSRIMHKLHLIHHQPLQGSKPVDVGIEGNFRVANALYFKIYFLVEEDRICILDILQEKGTKGI